MSRKIFDESMVDQGATQGIGGGHQATLDEIENALDNNVIVVVGMAHNPFVKKARKLLDASGKAYKYLEYGSYTSEWKKRLAIKMWVGWPTFPMVFVNKRFIGGKQELEQLQLDGRLESLLAEKPGQGSP